MTSRYDVIFHWCFWRGSQSAHKDAKNARALRSFIVVPQHKKEPISMDKRNSTGLRLIVPLLLLIAGIGVFIHEERVLEITRTMGLPVPVSRSTHVVTISSFQKAVHASYNEIIEDSGVSCGRESAATPTKTTKCFTRQRVNFETFPYKAHGGLRDEDRVVIEDLYYHAESVFEFGIGESTAIAAATNLPRYTGVDNSAEWVSKRDPLRLTATASTLQMLVKRQCGGSQ